MFIKSKVLAAATTLTLVSGVGAAGVLAAGPASAGTPSCGPGCINIFNQDIGPGFVVDVLRQGEKVGQPIILFRQSNFDPAEDWTDAFDGTAADFYEADLVDAKHALHYGCVPPVNFPDCYGQISVPVNDPAYTIQYAPNGGDSGMCAGVAATAVSGEGVTPPPCGMPAKTLGIADIIDNPATLLTGSVLLINGSNTNFSQASPPFIIPGLELGTVNNQLWVADFGGDSGMCAGVAATAVSGEGVTPPPCGMPAKTLGIADIIDNPATLLTGSVPLINGSNTNFSQPFVLTDPVGGYRTGMPLPQLQADNVTGRQAVQPGGTA